ncbi:atrial natriuretic peptide receptor 1-like [Octopus sinensis]|uniref:Guanylate cyclase n=1 Tax=Octopus sinensis TaxID=2607531 RepID=A0A7E6F548_9MOLL|nr:atrial natriuretic peptide receptor 1-like [Octopus sinensis]
MKPLNIVYSVIFLLSILSSTCYGHRKYKIGLLIPRHGYLSTFGWTTSVGAITMAIETIERDKILPPQSLSVVWRDTKGDPVNGAGMAVKLKYTEDVDVIIGPPFSHVNIPVGYLTAFWNLPHITWVATDPTLADKSVFNTLIRTMGPFNKVGMFLVQFFRIFKWKRAGMYSGTSGFCSFAGGGVRKQFEENNLTVTEDIMFIEETLTDSIMDFHLKKLSRDSRIIMLCTARAQLRKIMLRAYSMGMCKGNFVFLALYSFPKAFYTDPTDKKEESMPLWYGNDTDDETAKQAFQVVFDVTLASINTKQLEGFLELVPQKLTEAPWNSTEAVDLGLSGSRHSPYLFDAVYLYAILLNKSMALNISHRDGKQLLYLAKKTEFSGMSGKVEFDDNGDRDPFYWVWDYTSPTGIPRIIAVGSASPLYGQKAISFLWKPKWKTANGKPPPDIPVCGFDDELCPVDESIKNTIILGSLGALLTVIAASTIMRDLSHENINLFIGSCVDPPNLCVLFAYCSKGSLQDILENDDIKLDWTFKQSLLSDLVNGMAYIHSSSLVSHGRMKSSNCVVDSRWVLKITDYGPSALLHVQFNSRDSEEQGKFKALLWTAPEILRMHEPPSRGTQEGDVYSFGIILHEIAFRHGPFPVERMIPKDIVGRVRNGESVPFRPLRFRDTDVEPSITNLMEMCWAENPNQRPDFNGIKTYLRNHNKDTVGNIMDIILKRMERYAINLEDLVEQRTQALLEEKKKTDRLLYQLLPRSVAERLKVGETVYPEVFESVTIFFSDIVGFTTLSALSTPMQVVDLLNELYTLFDDVIAQHDVYKVETIGDAYMVASGLPHRNGDLHAGQIADMSLNIVSSILTFRIHHMPDRQLQVRIGIHTGPVCAGVVGLTMPRYCVFGDTVNTASRMESSGKGLRIHISESTRDALMKIGGYVVSLRGETPIKGKGTMTTYWMNGKVGFSKRLPDPEKIDEIEEILPMNNKV